MLKQTHSPMIQKTLQLPTDYSTWFQNNQDVEQLVLVGNLQFSELQNFETLLYNTHISTLDITNFSIENAEDVDSFYDKILDEYQDYEDKPYTPFVKLYSNKKYATVFSIAKHWSKVLSNDNKILIHMPTSKDLFIDDGIETIGNFAFTYEESIVSVQLPETIKIIGFECFQECSHLKKINLPNSIVDIGEYAFAETDLEEIVLPKSLQIVRAGCFSWCGILKKIDFGNAKILEPESFNGYLLDDIVLPEGIEEIGFNVFDHPESIYFPSTLKKMPKEFYYEWDSGDPKQIPFIEVHPDNPYFYSKDGTLYKRGETEPYLGYVYEEKRPGIRPLFPPKKLTKEYTPQEIYEIYKEKGISCKAIDTDETRFIISETSVIDRCLNKMFWEDTNNSSFSYIKDKYIMAKNDEGKHCIFDIKCSKIILEPEGTRDFICFIGENICAEDDVPRNNPSWLTVHLHGATMRRYGIINFSNDVLLPFEYKDISSFDEFGYARVHKGSKYGFIDEKFNIVIPIEYDYPYREFSSNFQFNEDVAILPKKNKFYYINRYNECLGVFLSPDIWEKKFHIFENNGLYGYTRQFGDQGSLPIYTKIEIINDETILVYDKDGHCKTIKYGDYFVAGYHIYQKS